MSNADAEHDGTITFDGSPIHVRRLEPDDYDASFWFFTTHPNYLEE